VNGFEAVGWCGNAAFFSRFLVQWWKSERARRSVAPAAFWWISLLGSAALAVYSVYRGEPVLLAGCLVNAAIFARNLRLAGPRGASPRRRSPWPLLAAAALALALLVLAGVSGARTDGTSSPAWLACAVAGQALWSSRFVVQWWSSERAGRSGFPLAFWWLSLLGNALLLAYALHLRDPVYAAGFALGPVVQVRNLMLAARARAAQAVRA